MENPEAAVAIVVAREPQESILLMRRTERVDDSWSGHWSLPGGRRDAADASPLDTALRELEEECGLRLERAQCGEALPYAVARRRTGRHLLVAPFVFRMERPLATRLAAEEAVEALWIPKSTLLDPQRHALRPVPTRPAEMLFPSIEMGCMPLWGFTYRLLTDWLLPAPEPESGRGAAGAVLDFVRSLGLAVVQDFVDRVATVAGKIPAAELIAYFTRPEHFHRAINCLEVHAERVRIAGPEFEEWEIRTSFPSR
jgi:8-oxo-dGTP pyrophosphatase MutT (NUDIX family)